MPSTLPEGDPAPSDGCLPEAARTEIPERSLGIYLHVPFCTTRCGYCDFNTYTAAELGARPARAVPATFKRSPPNSTLLRGYSGPVHHRSRTIFVGGGTPTLLPPGDLGRLVTAVERRFGLSADAEITTESNPESVSASDLARLRDAGFNRISFGMQSAVPAVLATLDRVHSPGRPAQAVGEARAAGFGQVSLDLIYGTPGRAWRTGRPAWRRPWPCGLTTSARTP